MKYIVVAFNTEAYDPVDIAFVSEIFNTYDEAVDRMVEFMKEDGFWEDLAVDEDSGRVVTPDGHRGYYVQGLISRN